MKTYELTAGGVIVTMETGMIVRAKRIVLATGYEVVEILKRGLINLNSSFAFVSEPVDDFPGWWEKCLPWETARPYFERLITVDGRAIVGGEERPRFQRHRHLWSECGNRKATFRARKPRINGIRVGARMQDGFLLGYPDSHGFIHIRGSLAAALFQSVAEGTSVSIAS